MAMSEIAGQACSGIGIALFVRWLLQLEIDTKWAAIVGAVIWAMQPLMDTRLGMAGPAMPGMVMATVVVVGVLGVMQVLHGV